MANQKKIKILLVDDDEMIRIYLTEIFWVHGLEAKYEIEDVNTAEKAEELIRNPETRPQLIFLDLVMPILKDGRVESTPEAGLNLLKKIKSDPELENIKVVIFSGFTKDDFKNEALKLGAEVFLNKGENLSQDILNCVEKYAPVTQLQ
ncbi:MAG: response regulator [Candidatus Magasanikbacteria bacterium]|nr:response regulator [Candidatus Magasanikbacteria bacterium]